ncbi:MAG: hypothetical protein IPH18_09390 [Chitinophagaceae bacterium]|nr:hypothetical protein [Chitinophagaceae bacterium]
MRIITFAYIISFILLTSDCTAQEILPKQLSANRTTKPVKVDGLINDEAWKEAAIMDSLVEFRPTVGRSENYETRTISYLMYNDDGIFLAAIAMNVPKTVLQLSWPAETVLEPMIISVLFLILTMIKSTDSNTL